VTEVTKERRASGVGAPTRRFLTGAVMGSGLLQMSPRDVPALRRKPGPVPEGWRRTPPSLLRYSDEQTVAGTAAVFTAIEALGVSPDRFEGWGVVSASRYLGRETLAAALRTFRAEGVWGISPHLIPHYALHCSSGTISLALGLHGPNLGVGGGARATAEGVLVALTWLAAGVVPGVWLVLSGWSPEWIPGQNIDSPATGECQALALALTPGGTETGRPAIRLVTGEESTPLTAPVDLVGLAGSLRTRGGLSPRTIATDSTGGIRVELLEGAEGRE
jgi:hypothetical protein